VFVTCCAGSGLCDELITLSQEFYQTRARARVCTCVIVCDLETSTMRWRGPDLGS
jgi:hypothetical protein